MLYDITLAATVAKVSQSTGAVGTLTKEPSTDSAYAEGGKAL